MKYIFRFALLGFLFLVSLHETINPKDIPKFQEEIFITSNVYSPSSKTKGKQTYEIKIQRFLQQILPKGYPKTQVFAYGGNVHDRISKKELGEIFSFPGPQFIFNRGDPAYITWQNQLSGKHLFNIQRTLDFMNFTQIDFDNFLPTVAHPHGMVTHYSSDGHPGAWFTKNNLKGMNFYELISLRKGQSAYYWTNQQQQATLFYHDHTMSMTRLNVYAGLAGFLTIHQNQSPLSKAFDQIHDIYLAIFDKTFNKDGSLYYPHTGPNPQTINMTNQFFGDTIVVNGKTWPKMTVKRNSYRIRLLNGGNARFLNLTFSVQGSSQQILFDIVKADSSYYKHPIRKSSILLFPSTRIQIVFNFSQYTNGTKILMKNNIGAPYPMMQQKYFDQQTTGKVMMFQIIGDLQTPQISLVLNKNLNPILNIYPLVPHEPITKKYHVLYQKKLQDESSDGMYIDGIDMSVGANIFKLGKTYDFYIINLSQDMHPMHFHLINFQFVKKAKINVKKYTTDWLEANNNMSIPFKTYPQIIDPQDYIEQKWIYPNEQQKVFRDVFGVQAQYVHVWRIRFTHNDGRMFSFNPKQGQFVWHCHMLQHQDFSMMRQFKLI